MKINHRHYILILVAMATLAVSISAYYLLYRKTVAQAGNYSDTMAEVNSEDDRKKQEKELIKIYESSKEDRAKVASYTLRDDKVVDFIESMEKIGGYAGVAFELVSVSSDKGNIRAGVSAKGSWANTMKALILLENAPFNVSLSNLSLTTSGELETDASAKSKTPGSNTWLLGLDIEVLTISTK